MAGIFSKLKLESDTTANREDTPAHATSMQSTPGYPSIPIRIWIFGGMFALLLLVLIVTLTISIRQARNSTAHLEIIARLQMHNQLLTHSSQQAAQGNEAAFSELKNSQSQLNRYMTLLAQGGLYRENTISSIDDELSATHLTPYTKQWHLEEKDVNLIIESHEPSVNPVHVIKEINLASTQLHTLIEQLIHRLEIVGNSSSETNLIKAMEILAQNVTKSINTILPNELPTAGAQKQLAQNRKQLSVTIQTLNQESPDINFSAIKDSDALKKLSHIEFLFREIDSHIGNIQNKVAQIITINAAANEISKNSKIKLHMTQALDDALQIRDKKTQSLINTVLYTSGILAVLALFLFVRSFIQNTRDQLKASKHEVKKTQQAILRLLNDMEKLADGDLTVRTVVTEDMTGAIADSINYTIEELHTLVEEVNKASTQVTAASSQTQHISSELLTAARQQSLKIEETTIAVLGMAESIGEVSETAAKSSKVAKQSLATAEKGTIAVRESIAGMNEIRTYMQDTSKRIKRLGESSQEIGEIVALISDITEQTNVLALNAAIQAASAGESGRGFSVIAQEVQRLAERSAEATKQVSALVRTIQGDTQDAVAAMERSTFGVTKGTKRSDAAGQALEEIEKVSKNLAQHVTSIFDTTNAQTQAANKVVENMEEILHITRKTTEGTTQTTLSIKQITGFASELKASVSNFKV